MAYHPLLSVAILLIASATSANSLLINGTEILQFRIRGRLTCDSPPPAPRPETKPILNGTNVALVCPGIEYPLARAVTDINGFYTLVYKVVGNVLFDPNKCFVVVRLPIVLCLIYPPTGILQATLTLVEVLQPLFNAIGMVSAGPLKLVT